MGQIVLKFFIEPLQQYKEVKGEVAHALHFYANGGSVMSPREELDEAHKHLRGLASKLRVCREKIPLYGFFAFIRWVPKKAALLKASTELTGWSNQVYAKKPSKLNRRKIIADCLKIKDVY